MIHQPAIATLTTVPSDDDLLTAATLYLMSRFAERPASDVALMVTQHLSLLQAQAPHGSLLHDTARRLFTRWQDLSEAHIATPIASPCGPIPRGVH
jgi:hypothetical protein